MKISHCLVTGNNSIVIVLEDGSQACVSMSNYEGNWRIGGVVFDNPLCEGNPKQMNEELRHG